MTGKEFRYIDDIISYGGKGGLDRDDNLTCEELDEVKDEEFQRLRRNYLEAKNLLCDYLGYEEASTYGK